MSETKSDAEIAYLRLRRRLRKLEEFARYVRDMPGVCTCELAGLFSGRKPVTKCLHCRAKAALEEPIP